MLVILWEVFSYHAGDFFKQVRRSEKAAPNPFFGACQTPGHGSKKCHKITPEEVEIQHLENKLQMGTKKFMLHYLGCACNLLVCLFLCSFDRSFFFQCCSCIVYN